jgi:DNA-binding response OmpR family regulator
MRCRLTRADDLLRLGRSTRPLQSMHDRRATDPANSAPGKVLVVDDAADARRLFSRFLKAAGFSVKTAASGEEALRSIAKDPPDVVLLDYEMPGLNGPEVCARIRASQTAEVAGLPVILVTAHTDEEEEIRCLEAGANDFVTKPVSRAVLQARLQTQLRLRAYARDLEEWRKAQEADLAAAQVTQRAIIPARFPNLAGWKFEVRFEPLIQVGGDIYGWQKLPDGSWLVWLADGTGHGAAAALLTALTAQLFRKAAEESSCPGEILDSVNREFRPVVAGSTFITAACVVLNANGKVRCSGAGHPPILIQRRDGSCESYRSERAMLGMGAETGGEISCSDLVPGDTVLLYTDGLYSLRSKSGERFSHEIVEQVLQTRPLDAEAIADLKKRLADESDGTAVDDDLTAIVIHRFG